MRRHFEDIGTGQNENQASSYIQCFFNKHVSSPGNVRIKYNERTNSLPGKRTFKNLLAMTENKIDYQYQLGRDDR